MEINISLDERHLSKLFEAGILHPSDLKCLDSASRDVVRALCLRLCHPKNCMQCEHLESCLQTSAQKFQGTQIAVSLPSDH
ncbi:MULTISPECIES: hypothetical protein [Thiomicrorhabdus]|uniref:Uncharacterized protein n=1 Tax=Thiomicrorhabdus heinhorstiae TaxID=2748010 RepID=A0ABS0BSE5_9GAMM|nr:MULTISPECIES: hypothetical protein [Thiomicrorhabdus]MBF6056778.1 hypothetical protein [Thiomicrorhabdus heinhorstiae]